MPGVRAWVDEVVDRPRKTVGKDTALIAGKRHDQDVHDGPMADENVVTEELVRLRLVWPGTARQARWIGLHAGEAEF